MHEQHLGSGNMIRARSSARAEGAGERVDSRLLCVRPASAQCPPSDRPLPFTLEAHRRPQGQSGLKAAEACKLGQAGFDCGKIGPEQARLRFAGVAFKTQQIGRMDSDPQFASIIQPLRQPTG